MVECQSTFSRPNMHECFLFISNDLVAPHSLPLQPLFLLRPHQSLWDIFHLNKLLDSQDFASDLGGMGVVHSLVSPMNAERDESPLLFVA